MINKIIAELWDEATDFFEDFIEVIFGVKDVRYHKNKEANLHGHLHVVKPAYVFAERLDNFLKIIFGLSIIASAVVSATVGFIKLSDLLDVLIQHVLGRFFMIIIGGSYLLLGAWKLIHLKKE